MMNNNDIHKKQVIAAFKQRGIDGAEIEFSGGNDEGGPDSRYFYRITDGEREEVKVGGRHYSSKFVDGSGRHHSGKFVDGKWQERTLTPEQVADNEFLNLIDDPIYRRWGSFAGEFQVYGVLRYDINDLDNWCVLSFDESSYDHYEMSL